MHPYLIFTMFATTKAFWLMVSRKKSSKRTNEIETHQGEKKKEIARKKRWCAKISYFI